MRSSQCASGLHGFCPATRETCDCTNCHLGPCERCAAVNLHKMFDAIDGSRVCVDCKRDDAHAQPVAPTICDDCGGPGAFRNPSTRRNEFRCATCHAKAGEPMSLTANTSTLLADCKGADVNDERHAWVHVKGTRFHCTRCLVKKFDAPARAAMRREDLNV